MRVLDRAGRNRYADRLICGPFIVDRLRPVPLTVYLLDRADCGRIVGLLIAADDGVGRYKLAPVPLVVYRLRGYNDYRLQRLVCSPFIVYGLGPIPILSYWLGGNDDGL